MPESGRYWKKLYIKELGYEEVKGGGKGSHMKLRKAGKPPVIIPDHKELVKGTEASLKKRFESEEEL
ncbi:MAG: putative RNA binding protein YcfA (HicA-like mRNA interferase family) [Halioglobus sp.]|jgi:predicted RNA binding protein YcfA (HicA-like mRNA interferase family)